MKVVNRLKGERINSEQNRDQAEQVGAAAFAYLAADPELFSRFASVTGVDLSDITEVAGTPEFLGGVLEYFLNDESLLLSFCENSGSQPELVQQSHMILSGHRANCGQTA